MSQKDEFAALRNRAIVGLIEHHRRRRWEVFRRFWSKTLAALFRL